MADFKELQKRTQLEQPIPNLLPPYSPATSGHYNRPFSSSTFPASSFSSYFICGLHGSCIFKCAWKYPCSSCEYFCCCCLCFCFCFCYYCFSKLLHIACCCWGQARKMFNSGGVASNYCIKYFAARLLLTRCDLTRNNCKVQTPVASRKEGRNCKGGGGGPKKIEPLIAL